MCELMSPQGSPAGSGVMNVHLRHDLAQFHEFHGSIERKLEWKHRQADCFQIVCHSDECHERRRTYCQPAKLAQGFNIETISLEKVTKTQKYRYFQKMLV